MNFLGMGPGELMVIMILALIVFGPQKLPEIGQGLGRAIGEFRRATSQITDEINRELSLETPPKPQQPAPSAQAPATTTAPAESPVSSETQGSPEILEIKPPTASTTFEAAKVNDAAAELPPMAPVETALESPVAYAPAEDATAVETSEAVADVPAKPARAPRARKPIIKKTTETTPPEEG